MWSDVRLLNMTTGALVLVLLAVLVFHGASWGMRHKSFDLRQVIVRSVNDGGGGNGGNAGNGADLQHVNAATVRTTALPALTGNLFTIDLAAARRAFEAVPWVRHASVTRRWPDQLVVEIEEHEPLAIWDDGRGVNTYGELFAVNAAELDQYDDLPEFAGPNGSEARVTQRYRDFEQWFAPIKLTPRVVVLSGRAAWTVTLAGLNVARPSTNQLARTVLLELGREQTPQTLQQRAERLVNNWKPMVARFGAVPQTVDLRYQNGYAIRMANH